MGNSFGRRGDYRIEISGWGLDNSFFAKRTDLLGSTDGEKQIELHRALPVGAIVFVRLLSSDPCSGSVPVAYQIETVVPMDRNGRCRMSLAQLHPHSKQSPADRRASKEVEDAGNVCDTSGAEMEFQHEEILL
jgi:hypothetical protein